MVKKMRTIKIPEEILLSLKMVQQKEKGNDLMRKSKPFHHFIRQWLQTTDEEILESAERMIQKKNNDNQNEEV